MAKYRAVPTPSIFRSAARGVVAAMSMSAARTVTSELGLIDKTPPDAVLRERAKGLLHRVPRGRQRAAVELAHWVYGSVGGAVYGLLPAGVRRHGLAGPAYGLLLWAGFEVALTPLLGLARNDTPSISDRLGLAADHLLYGMVLSLGRVRVDQSEDETA